MRQNDIPREYLPLRLMDPVPDVHDDDIEVADGIVQEFFMAMDLSSEEDDVPRYQSPPPSPASLEHQFHEAFQIVHRAQVLGEENVWQPLDQSDDSHDEDQLIYALDAWEEDEGEQRPVQAPLLEDILELRSLEIDPQPGHSRDLITPNSDNEGKVLVASSPLQSEYGSPPHLSPYWRYDPIPGPSIMGRIDEAEFEDRPMAVLEREVPLEPQSEPAEPLPSTSRGSHGIWNTGLAFGVDGSGRMTGSNFDFNRGVPEPAEDPGKGQSRKRNISTASGSAGSSRNLSKNKSRLKKTVTFDILPKKSKRESRSTEKKRSCNSEKPRDDARKEQEEEENIDNPIRPTYPGGAGNFAKRFPKIPGVVEWFTKQKRELELDADAELENLEYQTWESTRSKCKARRTNVSVETKQADVGQSMGLLHDCSDEEDEEEEVEEEEEEDPEPRRGRGRPRKKY